MYNVKCRDLRSRNANYIRSEQVLGTKLNKEKFDKTQSDSKCSIYSKGDKNINYTLTEINILAPKDCKRLHDCLVKRLHWIVCRMCGFKTTEMWCEHLLKTVIENENYMVL